MRKCIYTAIIGDYDDVHGSIDGGKTEGWDYLCITNNKNLKSDFWEIIYVEKPTNLSNTKFARNIKIEWQYWVGDYDINIWKDAHLLIKTDLNQFEDLMGNHSMLIFKHWDRSCLYDEGDAVVRGGRANANDVGIQLNSYSNEGYPRNNGLVETGVMIRKNNDENRKFSELWWNELFKHTGRDQLSFNYVLWKNPINIKIIESQLRNDKMFQLMPHKSENTKLISVVMAYYNRRQHLINTLHSMTKSVYKNFEVIIVDDGSYENHRIEDLQNQFKFIKLYRIEKEDKSHTNPCIPTNIALSHASGDIIIIQNPECFHYNDVFNYTVNNLSENKYLAFTTLNKDISNQLKTIDWSTDYQKQVNEIIDVNSPENHWYCHKTFNPKALNFCTAIKRKDLVDLNGFDERYAYGIERDDVEFLERIKRKNMEIVFVEDVIVIHQTHPPFQYSHTNTNELKSKNHQLYARTTAIENIIKVNPEKIVIQ